MTRRRPETDAAPFSPALDQLIQGDFASVADVRDLPPIEHVKPVDDRMDVEDVVVDEDR
jgi:hypothetical protein